MSKTTNRFTPEVGERAVRVVIDHECDHILGKKQSALIPPRAETAQ